MTPKKSVVDDEQPESPEMSTGALLNSEEEKKFMEAKVNALIETLEQEKQYNADLNVRVTAAGLAVEVMKDSREFGLSGVVIGQEVVKASVQIEAYLREGAK